MKPNHVAIIMDGNGRWAKKRNLERGEGHVEGAAAVRRVVRHARTLGIRSLTLFAFSTLNWGPTHREVSALMGLLVNFLRSEELEMLNNDIRQPQSASENDLRLRTCQSTARGGRALDGTV